MIATPSKCRRNRVLPTAWLLVAVLFPGLTPDPATAQEDALPRVVVLATGGTIASTYDEAFGALPAGLTADEIVQAV